ncbi:twin-arginine translocase TatA/TatE family subunit [Gulosibacter molinativorax]|uniref:Sec-independent protein translocase protein TatA n=1 Tax=Gulosibacter molinativorax TaxID=256821 RepID=A0ABT7CBG7_9MICO|nr:twin-arginine translocase TatA/TatE family subunit [Gulosibacter molinativorax]MDJ1372102.1 twin-arginine translocase TatA/TatE family subunit [Gulosibacter molinativorax]QUY62354.1 Sec-independent protein translocase protein TatA [Gulosibacter molinativorax]
MLQGFTGWHALIVLAVILLVFGASRLPKLAKSLGESMRILKEETMLDGVAEPASDGVAEGAVAEPSGTTWRAPAGRSINGSSGTAVSNDLARLAEISRAQDVSGKK